MGLEIAILKNLVYLKEPEAKRNLKIVKTLKVKVKVSVPGALSIPRILCAGVLCAERSKTDALQGRWSR